jgi:hypothetical protein
MTMATISEVFGRYLGEYPKASRSRKKVILDIICELTNFHRKAACRRFRNMQFQDGSVGNRRRGRPLLYGPDVTAALKDAWQTGSEVCGELLHSEIAEYVSILQRDKMWSHSQETTEKLLSMSEGTVKARLAKFTKSGRTHHGLSSTSPSLLKNIIPIFIGPWDGKPPGYGQTDTVAHCGNSLRGDFIYSVNYTDIATMWHGLAAQWNKGQQATQKSLEGIRQRLPFSLHGLHPDTGSEFINWQIVRWCDQEQIELSRSRPYHKNDNAYVEQKNGHVIRRFVGYSRLDLSELVPLLNELYVQLELYLNHFVASKKCLKKVRIGARYKRKYDKAQTPYLRVLAHPKIDEGSKQKLREEHAKLNPLLLKRKIDRLLLRIFKIQRIHRYPTSSNRDFR